MNPREISACLQQELREQTKSLRPIDQVCPELADNLNKAIDDFPFVSSLYLENITYYEQGASLEELSKEDVICVETAHLFAAAFGLPGEPDRVHLYKHQEEAIRKAHDDKNIIVCTGTGSGKTESFLIPVIDWIIRCHKEAPGEMYTKGVRAMILYPMNALVNDQMRRLREIFKARRSIPDNLSDFNYDAIKNATFGHYTGELVDEAEQISVSVPENLRGVEKKNYKRDKIEELCKVVKEAEYVDEAEVHYPHLSPEEKLENEYADRSAWEHYGADILITNYSMLERLMLDPEKAAAIFNNETWHHLVLDEAHTYDGVCGTDISLLMRRVAERCGGADRLRYIATSATLVSDKENNKVKSIRDNFAAKLFPAEPESFEVMLGASRVEDWPQPDIDDCGYAALCNADSTQAYKEILDEFRNCAGIPQEILPKEDCARLIDLTRWFKDWQQWSKQWVATANELLPCYEDGFIPVGDLVYIANLIAEANEEFEIILEANSSTKACYKLWENVLEAERDEYITQKTGETSRSATKTIKGCLQEFGSDNQIAIKSGLLSVCFTILFERMTALANTATGGNTRADIPSLACLKVKVSKVCFCKIKQMVETLAKIDEKQKIARIVLQAWNSALNPKDKAVESIGLGISNYILRRPHLKRLSSALAKSAGHGEQKDLQKEVFGNAGADEFDAFLQLVTLTQHPELKRKPLMDLRYHQTVSGISEMAVWFESDPESGYQAYFNPDDDGVMMRKDDREFPLYTLGLCHACAQPYIIAYRVQDNKDQNKWRLSRYMGTGNETRCAFSWLKGEHEIVDTDEVQDKYWFNPDKAFLLKHQDKPGNGYIEIFYYPAATNNKFCKCPACGEQQTNNGIISEYRSGSDRTRTAILRALVKHVDPESICSKSAIANGRKLLAFSDSRAGAAKLAINFDSYVESRIVGKHFLNAMQHVNDYRDAYVYDGYKQFPLAEELMTWRKLEREAAPNVRQLVFPNRDISCEAKGALWTYLPEFEKGLRQAQADRILDKEYAYKSQRDRMQPHLGSFSLPASLSLAALGLLRSPVRKNLIRQDVIRVYSHANARDKINADEAWLHVCENFNTPCEAEKFFDMMYQYFFLKAKLHTRYYDTAEEAVHYQNETNESIDGYNTESKKPIVFQGQARNTIKLYIHERGKFVKELSGKLAPGKDEKGTLDIIWKYLTNVRHILINIDSDNEYALNLNDVRLKLCPENMPGAEESQYYRIEEHTAQLKSAQGRYHQTLFSEGKINILSCSTTFEMGVDLGNLNCVFLNNMPPAVANYKQRAGRAGRRPGSVSYVLTYTGGFGHDSHYSKHPEEMFFGEVTMPHIDPQNRGALAKHLRAEALHSFLSWCSRCSPIRYTSWKKSGAFFLGKRVKYVRDNQQTGHWEEENAGAHCPENGFITLLEEWRNDQAVVEELQEHCKNLKPKEVELEYKVADDLLFQVSMNWEPDISKTGGYDFQDEENCLNLAGPRIARNDGNMPGGIYIAAAEKRYSDKYHSIAKNDGVSSALVQMLEEQTTDVLTHYQVLPSYAFPCDVISLLPAVDERSNAVDMSRDIRMGLFEYSPGQVVIANKRSYESDMPMYYTQDGGEPRYISAGDNNEQLYFCTGCERYFAADVGTCPMCGGIGTEVEATTPDAFRAKKSKKAGGFSVTIPPHIERLYTGGIRDPRQVPGTNLQIANSKHRTILYINEVDKDTYVHKVRTDIVLWSMCKEQGLPDWNDDRMRYAWQSALEAILKATAKVMKLCKRDVDGEVAIIDGRRHFVLFDNASGGAGTILSLLPSEHNMKAMQLAHDILDEAIKICECKHCKESGNAQSPEADKTPPVLHTEYLADPVGKREYCSCYGCLKSYDNQRIHARLDIHDAREILKAMLGNDNKAGGKQPAPEQARAQSGALVPKTQGGQKSMKDIVEEKKKERKKHKLIQDILVNMISLDDKLVVEKDGTELEVTIVGFANPDRMTILVKDANGNNFDLDLNDIIRKA